MSKRTPLYGHTDQATAFLVEDYPYGRRLRCRIRYWLEAHPKRGWRFCSQTENPKNLRWNNPKRSTYAVVAAAMFQDEQGHVHWDGLGLGTRPEVALGFVQTFPEADVTRLADTARERVVFLTALISGKAWFTINGQRQSRTEHDNERDAAELAGWREVLAAIEKE